MNKYLDETGAQQLWNKTKDLVDQLPTETWSFTLGDGTEVTKKVVVSHDTE